MNWTGSIVILEIHRTQSSRKPLLDHKLRSRLQNDFQNIFFLPFPNIFLIVFTTKRNVPWQWLLFFSRLKVTRSQSSLVDYVFADSAQVIRQAHPRPYINKHRSKISAHPKVDDLAVLTSSIVLWERVMVVMVAFSTSQHVSYRAFCRINGLIIRLVSPDVRKTINTPGSV